MLDISKSLTKMEAVSPSTALPYTRNQYPRWRPCHPQQFYPTHTKQLTKYILEIENYQVKIFQEAGIKMLLLSSAPYITFKEASLLCYETQKRLYCAVYLDNQNEPTYFIIY